MVRKLLLFLLFTISLIMGMSSREEIGLILYNYPYAQFVKENEEKPPESKVAFQIHITIAK
jgi:hypothetical protein